jgi:hypothetical protein
MPLLSNLAAAATAAAAAVAVCKSVWPASPVLLLPLLLANLALCALRCTPADSAASRFHA